MSTQLDPLETTAQDLHRFWVNLPTEAQWYALMRECRAWFGKNWRSQNKVRRKFSSNAGRHGLVVWFEVPDPRWATWIATKFALQVHADPQGKVAK